VARLPLSDEKRERGIDLIRQGMGRNAVAREIGVSSQTVSALAKKAGLSFDRTATAQATEARKVDAKARRLALGNALLGDLEEVRLRILRAETPRELQAIGQGLDALMRAYTNLAKVDGPEDPHGEERAKSMVGGLMNLISEAAQRIEPMNPTAEQH
jgi:hypothetical protein